MDWEKAYTILDKRHIDYLTGWKNQHEEEYTKCIDGFGRLDQGATSLVQEFVPGNA